MNAKIPIISVIMPVYNCEQYLTKAIESILNQTFIDFEFIIIDDGSTDRSLDIIHTFARKDERIRIFRNKENRGIFSSRNFGLEKSQGKYIAVMDADDISLPERFEKQVAFLEAHPAIDVLGTQKTSIDKNEIKSQTSKYFLSPGLVSWGLLFGYSLCHSSIMMRRIIIDEYGFRYHTQQVAQDFDLLVRISSDFKIANLSETLLLYRVHENNISAKKSKLQQQEAYDIIRSRIKDIISKNIPDEVISGIIFARHLKKHKEITNFRTASKVSRIIIKLLKYTSKWDLTDEELIFIRKNTASRLRRIWKSQHFHPFLLPFILYSFFIDPDFFTTSFVK